MSGYIEKCLIRSQPEEEKMRDLCQRVFANKDGRELLAKLVGASHPMRPRFDLSNPDLIAAAWRDGQADVISFLWRYGSDLKAIPEPSQEP